jgi:hypothetical protein
MALAPLAGLVGCADSETSAPIVPLDDLPPGLSISEPVGAGEGGGLAATLAGVVYISASPGTFPDAGSVAVTNLANGESGAASIVDGGFDPIALTGVPDDVLEIAVRHSDGTIRTIRAPVPKRKRPRVVRTRPPKDATDVPLNAAAVVVFSEPVDERTITPEMIELTLEGGRVAGELTLSGDGLQAEFRPGELLAPQSTYTLTVTTGIADLDGDPLEEPVAASFTTGSAAAPHGVIAFRRESDIYAINADGTGLHMLVGDGLSPKWSPDGRRIAFARRIQLNLKIFVMNLDGSGLLQLSDGNHLGPSWSPDGSKIAFFGNQGVEVTARVYVVNDDGTGLAGLAEGGWPAWSPDGTRIAFSTGLDNWEIYIMNADGTNPVNLTQSPDTSDSRPAWSPDGSKIAFESNLEGNTEIFVMNADGTGRMRLTDSPGADINPTWSPDGRYIAFASDRAGDMAIWIMRSDGTVLEVLTADPVGDLGDFAPTWKR